jgi:hypothetical protein
MPVFDRCAGIEHEMRSPRGVFVNLYVPSRVTWKQGSTRRRTHAGDTISDISAAEDLASNTLRVGCFLFHEPVTLCISFLLTRLLLEVRELFRQRLYLVRVPSASQCKDQVVERCLIRR